ncbi:hypothetical protein GTY83_19190 [Streptomyces sp. SID4928]|uniref:hypothetical protein n=1 Tax=unclassified Streptomyces TaxID=2593676 RepID=UPI0001C1A56B|nr:hypothetical protein [Streptomyces sp. ACT-1]EGE43198.1 hypothetical protein SACT1_3867 [Streptomyces sp. ACT-1]MYR51236.1 hypothetical protein [Streptomyces sp. SID4928]
MTAPQPANDLTEAEVFGAVGYLARSLAHLGAGHSIADLDEPHVLYVAPTQADVDSARHMAGRLNPQPATVPPHFDGERITVDGTTYDTVDKHVVLFDNDGCAFLTLYRDGQELTNTAIPADQAEDLGAALTHGAATGQLRQEQPAATFEDIVDLDLGLSPMYRAVIQAEAHGPDQLPIVIGVKAWQLLDREQQAKSLKDLLHAYVDVVQHQRDGRPIR